MRGDVNGYFLSSLSFLKFCRAHAQESSIGTRSNKHNDAHDRGKCGLRTNNLFESV